MLKQVMPLFSVLPNSMDEVNLLSTSLMQTEKNVCISIPMFRNRRGTIVNRGKIAYGTDDVMKLFPQETAEPILGGRYWIKPFETDSCSKSGYRSLPKATELYVDPVHASDFTLR